MINLVIMALGAAFWLLTKYNAARKLKGYCISKFIDNNAVPLALNLIFGGALVLGVDDSQMANIVIAGVSMSKMLWFLVGMGGQFIARKLFKTYLNRIV